MTLSVNEVRQLLDEAQIAPKKSLGQIFVIDPNTVRRIARLAEVGHGDKVLEIGAGLGSLTLALVETGANVLALETDRALIPLLRSRLGQTSRSFKRMCVTFPWIRCLRALIGI